MSKGFSGLAEELSTKDGGNMEAILTKTVTIKTFTGYITIPAETIIHIDPTTNIGYDPKTERYFDLSHDEWKIIN